MSHPHRFKLAFILYKNAVIAAFSPQTNASFDDVIRRCSNVLPLRQAQANTKTGENAGPGNCRRSPLSADPGGEVHIQISVWVWFDGRFDADLVSGTSYLVSDMSAPAER
jgi:hypothetical protein